MEIESIETALYRLPLELGEGSPTGMVGDAGLWSTRRSTRSGCAAA